MKKKKIAFVIHSMTAGGAERVISILSNYLVHYYEVFIIVLVDDPSFYALNPSVTLLLSKYRAKPTKGNLDAIQSNFKIYNSILTILKEEKIDLAIGFITANNILATLAAKRLRIPVIISERNNPFMKGVSMSIFWRVLRRWVYPMADILTVQTPRIKTFYSPFIKEQKLVTIPNPINPDFNRTLRVKKENIVINVGSLEYQKGQDVLIRAFANAQLEGWELHILGEGSQRNKLTALITELDLQERILLLGEKTKISDHYNSGKIFALTSRYEGLPNALLEAMYFGLACISTNCPNGPAEMIENGVNGYLVPVDEIHALTLKLQNLAANDDLRVVMGQAAIKSVEQYHPDVIVGKWKHLIDGLLDTHN